MKFLYFTFIILLIMLMLIMIMTKKSFQDKEKNSSFECGFDCLFMPRSPFSLRFFKIAIIFLIFDIEIMIIMPLPMINFNMTMMYLLSSMIILFIIILGLLYEWNQGAINWIK